ncbi:apoptosis-stimulating of p53 protein 2 isoform X3 [Anthonomus grandis grandis]|uniref:apoptosis-stimulating of p53 protein 2 isoform X3 n=1 Tax=Anthonomus grandis grandis TaxID=2921223 RepID=UPI002165E930|nr:apoptosis-stimulating of p53 protein 2 isoform X3 [Anthonomus grandis grandis]XP_050298816.1 apoptosis-stimulating of p53 protein 2 isoform X3 [Anthonomus grandis grandis]
MLACVCQPADPSVFRRSPVPLGAPPLKISANQGALPKPGRSVRVNPPYVSPTPTVITNNGPNFGGTERLVHINVKTAGPKNKAKADPQDAELDPRGSNARLDKLVQTSIATECDKTRRKSEENLPTEEDSTTNNYKGESLYEKLPDGVQLTLTELRDMACRQQSQIDSQHQLLAAKEQRLRYLKEQDARAQRVQAESERLRRLRDRVEAQELKLRKLRALRGQVDHQKQNNISLTSDLDSIRALFNEKEKELSLAVAKVEELTRQLEELRRGRTTTRDPPPASALELDKLRRELMYRNKLNEQQNQRLNQQREALTARQEEMSAIDKRISELQERLQRKRILNQQLASQISAASHKAAYHQFVRLTGTAEQNNQAFARSQHVNNNNAANGLLRSNIAAVEPYNHVPLQQNQQMRPNQTQEHIAYHPAYQPNNQHIKPESNPNINDAQDLANKMANVYLPRTDLMEENLKEFPVSKSDPKYQTLPYNTKFTVNLLTSSKNLKGENNVSEKDDNNYISNNFNNNMNSVIQASHMMAHSAPLTQVNKNIATPLNQHDLLTRKSSDSKDQNLFSNGVSNNKEDLILKSSKFQNEPPYPNSYGPPTYQKPISSVAPTSIHHTGIPSTVYQTSSIKVQPVEPQTTAKTISSVQSPQGSILSPPQSSSTPLSTPEVSLDSTPKPALPPKPAIKPPPRLTQLIADETHSPRPPPLPLTEPPEDKSSPPLAAKPPASLLLSQKPLSIDPNKPIPNLPQASEMIIKAKPLNIKKQPLSEQPKLRSLSSSSKLNGLIMNSKRIEMPPVFQYQESQEKLEIKPLEEVTPKDETDRCSRSSVDETSSVDSKEPKDEHNVIRRTKKGNLKQTGKQNLSRRVSFDPLALLLDASLEGELELVKKTATQVTNPSAANDEGITALHNAICAGHIEIVKFLVEFGCDVNAQDSDGWTPLHCAASCNNLTMVKFLVEHGACIFATTLSDHETAAEKCEEDEEGFDGCSEYLYSVQEKLGILNGGTVYAVFDYTAQQPDELTFKAGQQFTVLRKGDENEREWWWSNLGDKEGYVPRNLLGLYPRVQKNEDSN